MSDCSETKHSEWRPRSPCTPVGRHAFHHLMVSVLCLAFLGLWLWLRVYPRLFALRRSDWSGGIRQRINTTA